MNNLLFLPMSVCLGVALGFLYFGGLWLTVRRLPRAENPALLTLLSFLGRTSTVVVGLGLIVSSAQELAPLHLLACLVPFFWIRNRLVQRLQPRLSAK